MEYTVNSAVWESDFERYANDTFKKISMISNGSVEYNPDAVHNAFKIYKSEIFPKVKSEMPPEYLSDKHKILAGYLIAFTRKNCIPFTFCRAKMTGNAPFLVLVPTEYFLATVSPHILNAFTGAAKLKGLPGTYLAKFPTAIHSWDGNKTTDYRYDHFIKILHLLIKEQPVISTSLIFSLSSLLFALEACGDIAEYNLAEKYYA